MLNELMQIFLHFIQYSFLKCVNLTAMWRYFGFIIQGDLAVQFCKKFCLTGIKSTETETYTKTEEIGSQSDVVFAAHTHLF